MDEGTFILIFVSILQKSHLEVHATVRYLLVTTVIDV